MRKFLIILTINIYEIYYNYTHVKKKPSTVPIFSLRMNQLLYHLSHVKQRLRTTWCIYTYKRKNLLDLKYRKSLAAENDASKSYLFPIN